MATKTPTPSPDQAAQPSAPKPKPPSAPKPLSPKEEIAFLRKRIAEDTARVHELEHPFVEFPKIVTSPDGAQRTFASREAQDAAGPEWADQPKKA